MGESAVLSAHHREGFGAEQGSQRTAERRAAELPRAFAAKRSQHASGQPARLFASFLTFLSNKEKLKCEKVPDNFVKKQLLFWQK